MHAPLLIQERIRLAVPLFCQHTCAGSAGEELGFITNLRYRQDTQGSILIGCNCSPQGLSMWRGEWVDRETWAHCAPVGKGHASSVRGNDSGKGIHG